MDFLTCTFILPIVLNNSINSKSLKHSENSTDFQNQIATPFVPSMSFSTQLNDCNVVLEDISFSCGATKPQMLDLIQDKTLTTDSHHISDSNFLLNFCLKTPIAWGNSVDVWWTQVDIIVSEKLHLCATLADQKPSSLFSLFLSFFFFCCCFCFKLLLTCLWYKIECN